MNDFIERIDEVTELACGWCRARLAEDAVSLDFCSPEHQALWTEQHGEPIADYREAGLGFMDLDGGNSRIVTDPADGVVTVHVYPDLTGINAAMARLEEPWRRAAGMFQVFARALADSQEDQGEWLPVGCIEGPSGLDFDRAARRRPARDGGEFRSGNWPSYPTVPLVEYPTIDRCHKRPVCASEVTFPADSREGRMQVALEARRNRNTGPPKSMRAPKRLDGKGRW